MTTQPPVTTTAANLNDDSTSVTVTKVVVQKVSQKLTSILTSSTAAYNVPKLVAGTEEVKKTITDESRISQQMAGQTFKVDTSQPLYEDDSHIFVYFIVAMLICAVGYVVFHNKRKIFALIIEGRQTHGETRRSGGVNYKRLNTEPPAVSLA